MRKNFSDITPLAPKKEEGYPSVEEGASKVGGERMKARCLKRTLRGRDRLCRQDERAQVGDVR
jgi:hypothetical protein